MNNVKVYLKLSSELKHKFEFLKQEISRENTKKRAKLSTGYSNSMKTSDIIRSNYLSSSTSRQKPKKVEKKSEMNINLHSIIKGTSKNGADLFSIRSMLKILNR